MLGGSKRMWAGRFMRGACAAISLATGIVADAARAPAQQEPRDQEQQLRPAAAAEDGKTEADTRSHTVTAPARVEWHTLNAFRFFNNPADTEMHRATWSALSPEERKTPVLSAERALASRHADGWAANLKSKPCWDAAHNRFVCPDARPYVSPESHRVVAELKDVPDAAEVDCTWLTAPRGGSSRRGVAITARCDRPVEFDIPYPAGARVTVEVGGRPIASDDMQVADLLIVGIGDSFASGEGNPDVPVRFSRERSADYGKETKAPGASSLIGYPTRVGSWRQIGDREFLAENARWLDQACHRSMYSHQLRASLQLALENPHRAVTFVGVACSGADVAMGVFLRYKGNEWVVSPPEYSQISAIAEAQCGSHEAPMQDLPEAYHMGGKIPDLEGGLVLRKCRTEQARKIDLYMVSIGGNDVGFARLVANAVLADASNLKMLGGWFGQVHGAAEAEAALDVLDERYKALNRALHNILHLPWDQNDRVLLTAYPAMALMEDGRSMCPDGSAGMDVIGDLQLSAKKAREGQQVADKLNRIMRASAKDYGWTFVDRHRDQFLGRGICAGWTDNGLSSVDDLRIPRKVNGEWEPYNPADYQPYASRQRWFRTPNDAFMTANFHVSTSLLQSVLKLQTLSWFQLLLASTYSGAFHPTAEGHAAIADAVAERARAVLAKYERLAERRQ